MSSFKELLALDLDALAAPAKRERKKPEAFVAGDQSGAPAEAPAAEGAEGAAAPAKKPTASSSTKQRKASASKVKHDSEGVSPSAATESGSGAVAAAAAAPEPPLPPPPPKPALKVKVGNSMGSGGPGSSGGPSSLGSAGKDDDDSKQRRKQRRETEEQRLQVMESLGPVQQLLMLGCVPAEADQEVWKDFATLTNGKVEVRASRVPTVLGDYSVGRGLFACVDFAQNELITIYGGELITTEEARLRKDTRDSQSRRYLMRVSDSDFLVDGWHYALGIEETAKEGSDGICWPIEPDATQWLQARRAPHSTPHPAASRQLPTPSSLAPCRPRATCACDAVRRAARRWPTTPTATTPTRR